MLGSWARPGSQLLNPRHIGCGPLSALLFRAPHILGVASWVLSLARPDAGLPAVDDNLAS